MKSIEEYGADLALIALRSHFNPHFEGLVAQATVTYIRRVLCDHIDFAADVWYVEHQP